MAYANERSASETRPLPESAHPVQRDDATGAETRVWAKLEQPPTPVTARRLLPFGASRARGSLTTPKISSPAAARGGVDQRQHEAVDSLRILREGFAPERTARVDAASQQQPLGRLPLEGPSEERGPLEVGGENRALRPASTRRAPWLAAPFEASRRERRTRSRRARGRDRTGAPLPPRCSTPGRAAVSSETREQPLQEPATTSRFVQIVERREASSSILQARQEAAGAEEGHRRKLARREDS